MSHSGLGRGDEARERGSGLIAPMFGPSVVWRAVLLSLRLWTCVCCFLCKRAVGALLCWSLFLCLLSSVVSLQPLLCSLLLSLFCLSPFFPLSILSSVVVFFIGLFSPLLLLLLFSHVCSLLFSFLHFSRLCSSFSLSLSSAPPLLSSVAHAPPCGKGGLVQGGIEAEEAGLEHADARALGCGPAQPQRAPRSRKRKRGRLRRTQASPPGKGKQRHCGREEEEEGQERAERKERREGEKQREEVSERGRRGFLYVCVCVCVCVERYSLWRKHTKRKSRSKKVGDRPSGNLPTAPLLSSAVNTRRIVQEREMRERGSDRIDHSKRQWRQKERGERRRDGERVAAFPFL